MSSTFRFLGVVTGNFDADAGTIACGTTARKINMQVTLDTNSGYEIAVKPVTSSTATASKQSCSAILSDLGTYECLRPAGGRRQWYMAYRVYNGATAGSGGADDQYAIEQLG